MKVFKATNAAMECTMGQGKFQYAIGVPFTAENSKCGRTGLHACEYVLDCTRYYDLGRGNRFFLAEAEGDIAEDGTDTRISCTRLTLVQELTPREIAAQAVIYIVQHPRREGWEISNSFVTAAMDRSQALLPGAIAIARGETPRAKGVTGAHLGLVREEDGEITDARILTVGRHGIMPDTWYTVRDGMPEEADAVEGGQNETEAD